MSVLCEQGTRALGQVFVAVDRQRLAALPHDLAHERGGVARSRADFSTRTPGCRSRARKCRWVACGGITGSTARPSGPRLVELGVCWFTTSFISGLRHRLSPAAATVRTCRTRRSSLPKAGSQRHDGHPWPGPLPRARRPRRPGAQESNGCRRTRRPAASQPSHSLTSTDITPGAAADHAVTKQ